MSGTCQVAYEFQGVSILGLCTFFSMLTISAAALAVGGKGTLHSSEIIDNPDNSRTFIRPSISLPGVSVQQRFGIRKGVPGACHLGGMDDFLSDYVQWSKDMIKSVAIDRDGVVSGAEMGFYIEAMTCVSSPSPLPTLVAQNVQHHSNGSITVKMPVLYHGPASYPIHSGHEGACRLLGYDKPIKYSLEWSDTRATSVSLDADGRIYTRATGNFLTAMDCEGKAQ